MGYTKETTLHDLFIKAAALEDDASEMEKHLFQTITEVQNLRAWVAKLTVLIFVLTLLIAGIIAQLYFKQ